MENPSSDIPEAKFSKIKLAIKELLTKPAKYASKKRQLKKATQAETTKSIIIDLFNIVDLAYGTDYALYNVNLVTVPGYLFTFETGQQNKDKLILIHGFGTTMATYYKMMPFFRKHFHVYAFDMYGMGCSYSDKVDASTPAEAHELYLKTIEEWRQELDINNFYLLGHSLGGYLSVHYLEKYMPTCKGVFLMSPAGMNHMPPNEVEDFMDGRSIFQKGF
jgi:pimeloyl-ACP methyl ester carboxylesterase